MSAAVASSPDVADPSRWHELVHSSDRREFVAAARGHLSSRFGLDSVRACYDAEQPITSWKELAGADYPLIGLPESMGGAGTFVDTVALMEAAGRELLPLPLLSTVMAWQTLAAAGAGEINRERMAALAVVGDPTLERAADRTVTVLDGVVAQDLVLVDVTGAGVVVARGDLTAHAAVAHRHVDPSRPLAVFRRDDVAVEVVTELAIPTDDVLARARTVLGADLTGVAAAALDRAVEHAVEREQFGKKIGAFQGVKHRLADVYVAVERARSLTRAAAVTLADGAADDVSGAELSLLAKAAATDAAVEATRAYVQVLGAMGMTFEADAHLYFRRAQQTAPVLGSAAACYRRAAATRREALR
ncbi:acyl-CoA dehydrogenase family protein [Mumia qirimensis]|uniref:acyl-CoA dehydrogenase family protein n=1 Tax=Mumia qirimensis TaxID=3234852 RepID=UPI00351CC2B1